MAPAVSDTWWRQARHWIFGRVLSRLPSQPPHSGKRRLKVTLRAGWRRRG